MATAIKKCRVCGKLYEACHTARTNAGVFRWQEVACSPECGSIYLARIKESRNIKPADVKDANAVNEVTAIEPIDDDEDDEELNDGLDEYFDDAE